MADRKEWTIQEQQFLAQIVKEYMKNFTKLNWVFISKAFNKRNPSFLRSNKQCKQKWNFLSSQRIQSAASKNQGSSIDLNLFLQLFREYGRKWSFLSQYFPNQNQNSLKNWFYCALRKGLRHLNLYNRYVRTDKNYKVYQKDFLSKLISAVEGSAATENLIIYGKEVPELSINIQQKLIKCSLEQPRVQMRLEKEGTHLYEILEQECIRFSHCCKFKKSKNTKKRSQNFLSYVRQQKSSSNFQKNIEEEKQVKLEEKSEAFSQQAKVPGNSQIEDKPAQLEQKIKKEEEFTDQNYHWFFYLPILLAPKIEAKAQTF